MIISNSTTVYWNIVDKYDYRIIYCWLKELSMYVFVFGKHKPFVFFECMKLGLRDRG